MSLRIIYGRAGTGKSKFIYDEIKTNKKDNIYIITPEQFSFTAEQKLMENEKAVLNAEVISFNRLAYRCINEIGGVINTNITKCGKAMLIYSILQDKKNNFVFLNKSDENIEICMRLISELKKHGIKIEDLKKEKEKLENENNKKNNLIINKLNDIILIYENFENKIKNKYIDETDLLTILSENIDKINLLNNSVIYIDEFSGFTEQEYLIIKKLIKIAKNVTITFCIDNYEFDTDPNLDIFYPNKITLKKIINLLDENEKIEKINLNNLYRFKNEDLKNIENNLFNLKIKNNKKNTEKNIEEKNNEKNKLEKNKIKNINLILTKNNYTEIENVAKKIINLIKYENMRFKDISIITKNSENYSSVAKIIFNKYNIPIFIDEKRDLNQNIIVQYILSILEIFIKNYSYESIFNYLKLGFLEIEENDIFKLENYAQKYGIKNNKFKNDFIYGINEKNKEEINYLNNLRKEIIEPLINLKNKFDEEKTVKNISKQFYLFLINQNIENKINKKINKLKENDFYDLAKEYEESYKIIINILDEMNLIFGDEKITIDKFSKILKIGLKNSGLGKIPGTQDQVILGDIDRSRSRKTKAVFILGLNDGVFPSVNKNEGFIDDEDREYLKQDGIEFAKGTLENLYDDNFNIYRAFTTAEEKLFLSYDSADSEGKTLRPSNLIFRIKKLFPDLEEESDLIDKNYEELLNNNLNNFEFNFYENINEENIKKLYGNNLDTSISKLEKYRSCPFSYYMQYILKLKEKEELKIKSFDTGSFMHDVINSFFEEINNKENNSEENKNKLKNISDEEIEKIINKKIDEKLLNENNYIFNSSEKYKLLVYRLKRIIIKSLKYIIKSLVQSEFDLEGTEVEFADKGKYKPIILNLENGKTVEITGKIDRIDVAKDENKNYVRIIDYKSSVKSLDFGRVYAGLQLQLITYLDAVCNLEDLAPAGVLYFNLLEQVINSDRKLTEEEIENRIKDNFKMKGLILADVKVARMQDKSLTTGKSELIPAYIDKSGNFSQTRSSIATDEEFIKLQKYINKTIKEISKEIFSGNIELKPYYKDRKTPCEYCIYKNICGFNSGICKQKYRFIKNMNKEEFFNEFK